MNLSELLNNLDDFLSNAKLVNRITFEEDGDTYCKSLYELPNGMTVEKITIMTTEGSEDLLKLEDLRDKLRRAVEQEDYELAADLKKQADALQAKVETENPGLKNEI